MPEAVIVATARTPIGRAFKGSFTEERADDMAAFIVDAVLNKVPQLDRNTVDDLILGCGNRKSTRLNSSHTDISRMPSSA